MSVNETVIQNSGMAAGCRCIYEIEEKAIDQGGFVDRLLFVSLLNLLQTK